jgi:hypothetical protein
LRERALWDRKRHKDDPCFKGKGAESKLCWWSRHIHAQKPAALNNGACAIGDQVPELN